jgi:hypothetical protein
MGRTIPELIAAAFAGDTLTPADASRLHRYMRRTARLDRAYAGDVPEPVDQGAAFVAYRADIRRRLLSYTVPELRAVIRELLYLLGIFVDLAASQEGAQRRQRKQQSQSGVLGVATRRVAAEMFLDQITAIKTQDPDTTDVVAAQRYLRKTDPTWSDADQAARQRKTSAATRRLRRARKNTGHKRR